MYYCLSPFLFWSEKADVAEEEEEEKKKKKKKMMMIIITRTISK